VIDRLQRVYASSPGRPEVGSPDHPMRRVTYQIAFEGGWSPERAAKVRELFDGLAAEWHTRFHESRTEPLRDALERGGVPRAGPCLEVGSGTGFGTRELAGHFDRVFALDLSRQMLVRAPAELGPRIQADAAALPFAAASLRAVVLVNALLFPAEVARVLTPRGCVVWVNSLGECTPIHLPAEDVARALPGEWTGTAAEAGWGTWCVLRRAA